VRVVVHLFCIVQVIPVVGDVDVTRLDCGVGYGEW